MAEQQDNATEKPTAKRLEKARERGQFARAPEIGVVAVLFAAYFGLKYITPNNALQVASIGTGVFGHLEKYQLQPQMIVELARESVFTVFSMAMPMMVLCMLAGVLAGAGQSGFAVTGEVIGFDFEKINPAAGFERVFSKAGLVRMLIDFVKFLVVGALLYEVVRDMFDDPIFHSPVPLTRLATFILENAVRILGRLGLAMALLAAANYIYQMRKTEKDLMMAKHEIKEESRESMGDPQIKAAQRAMARRLAQKQMLDSVPTADVIVTNPTHYAVALKYERGKDQAPMVIAKGENLMAHRIKEIGRAHDVPTVENKPVARALFRFGKVGEQIPPQLYQAIAEILGYVYRTHRYYFHQLKMRRMSA